MDGFGLENRVCVNTPEKRTFFLSRKPIDIALPECPIFDPRDIRSYVTAIDEQISPEIFLSGEDSVLDEVD